MGLLIRGLKVNTSISPAKIRIAWWKVKSRAILRAPSPVFVFLSEPRPSTGVGEKRPTLIQRASPDLLIATQLSVSLF